MADSMFLSVHPFPVFLFRNVVYVFSMCSQGNSVCTCCKQVHESGAHTPHGHTVRPEQAYRQSVLGADQLPLVAGLQHFGQKLVPPSGLLPL